MDELLDTRLRDLLAERRGDWHGIAGRAGVSHSWISKFVNGRIPNPGYGTLRKLLAVVQAQQPAQEVRDAA
ncbi:MAG: helix-turn-helix domain-containing protein [Piscinibacter sp.]|nr:helix-turn-helix domain-containing protein [Piscinibacter sp.]